MIERRNLTRSEKVTNYIRALIFKCRRIVRSRRYGLRSKRYLVKNGFPIGKQSGEEAYIALWRKLSNRVEPYSYRLFSHYMGHVPYIVPEDIGQSYIEYYLNPIKYRPFYNDKNLYEKYIPDKAILPHAYVRRINGGHMLDGDYSLLATFGASNADEMLIRGLGGGRILNLKAKRGEW